MSIRRHPGLRLAHVPARLHRGRHPRDQVTQGPRRQAHRRPALHHDRRGLDPRAARARQRCRSLGRRLGRRRHGGAEAARPADRAAAAEAGEDHREPERKVPERAAGGRRDPGRDRRRPAVLHQDESPRATALPRLPRGGKGLCPANEDLPDHASRGAAARFPRAASVRGDEPVQRSQRVESDCPEAHALSRCVALHAAMAAGRSRRDRRGVRRRSLALRRRAQPPDAGSPSAIPARPVDDRPRREGRRPVHASPRPQLERTLSRDDGHGAARYRNPARRKPSR